MPRSKREVPLKQGGQPKPEAEKMKDRTVPMNDVRWNYAKAQQGGAAAFIRRLIDDWRGRRGE